MTEHCVCCGREIPEGGQTCVLCQKKADRKTPPFLLPCPFCGGKANLFKVRLPDNILTYEVDCENSECEVSACTALHDTPEEAAAVWNRRA